MTRRASTQSDSSTILDSTENEIPTSNTPRNDSLYDRVQALNALLIAFITLSILSIITIILFFTFLSFTIRVTYGFVRNVFHWNPYVLGSSGHLLGELLGEFTYAFWVGWGVWMD